MKKLVCLVLSFVLLLSFTTQSMAASPDVKVILDGSKVSFPDVNPQILDGRTMVPIRAVFEQMGGSVEWDQPTKCITIQYQGNVLKLTINSSTMVLNGEVLSKKLDVTPALISSRTMLPLRYPAEVLGCKVNWNQSTKTVTVASPKQLFHDAYLLAKAVGADRTTASKNLKNKIDVISGLNSSLNELKTVNDRNNLIYSAGFLVLDCVNITTATKAALSEGSDEMFDAITDAQETMLGYATQTESMSVQDYFYCSAKASYQSGMNYLNSFIELHGRYLDKGYFTHEEALAYLLAHNLIELDRETIYAAVQLLLEEVPSGVLDASLHTAKKFAFTFLPGSLDENVENLLDLGSEAISRYYERVQYYQGNIRNLLS